MVLANAFVESLTLALSAWGSVIAVFSSVSGFIALATGRSYREIEQQVIYGSVAGAPTGFLVAMASVILESV